MLNSLFTPFASTPATLHFDPNTPSQIEGFTLHYDARWLNVRVEKVRESIEIEIQGCHNAFGPHMFELAHGNYTIALGIDYTTHPATIVDDTNLLFAEIPTEDEAKKVLQLIDRIIQIYQRYIRMMQGFEEYGKELQCEWQDDTASLHIDGRRGNVSVYNIASDTNAVILVYLQSDDDHCIFEQYMSHKSCLPPKTPCVQYVFSYNGKHFSDAQYIENEVYMFIFRFPEKEAQIRMLVDAAVDVIKTH